MKSIVWVIVAVIVFRALSGGINIQTDSAPASVAGVTTRGFSVPTAKPVQMAPTASATQPTIDAQATAEAAWEDAGAVEGEAPVVGVAELPTAVVVAQVYTDIVQPSQAQLDEATAPLLPTALPPLVYPTAIPTGQGYRMVSAPMDAIGTLKYGVIAKRPDGTYGLIWNLRGVPLTDAAQKELAGLIMGGLVRGDDVPPGV